VLPGDDVIVRNLNTAFDHIFGRGPSASPIFGPDTVILDLGDLTEPKLDPASETGDFALPRDPIQSDTEAYEAYEAQEGSVVTDLRHEEVRIYIFADGTEVEVDNPVELTVGPDGSHQITPHDRVGIIVPKGWIKCEVHPKQGAACFAGHTPVNEIA